MRITYTGSTPLEIDHDGTTTRVQSGQTIEVSVAVGEELCARKDFKRAASSPSPGGEGRGEGEHPATRNPQPKTQPSTLP